MKNAGAISWAGTDAGEAALVERCVARDQAACAELVAAHQRMVYALAFHLLGDRDDALDVSQEVFLRVFRTLPSFRGQSALRTWIFRIVVNQARNRQRWWNRRRRGSQVSLDDHISLCGDMAVAGRGAARSAAGQQGNRHADLAARSIACRSIRRRPSSCARWTGCATTRSRSRSASPWAP